MQMVRVGLCVMAGFFGAPETASARHDLEGAGRQTGRASWYGGRKSVRGVVMRVHIEGLTAAHRTLPLGTLIRVTNRKNGQSAEVTITDRGPRTRRRIIDVSREAARRLGMVGDGVATVTIEVIEP